MKTLQATLLALLGLQWAVPSGAVNFALDKPVTLIGAFGTGSGYLDPNNLPPLPPAAIVTDGILQNGYWTNGVWWDEQNSGVHSSVVVDLLGEYAINRFEVVVDNNDVYLLEYRDSSGSWAPAWEIPNVGGFGLTLRTTTLAEPISATALRLSAFPPFQSGMDFAYSVSEIQAAFVPEPSSGLLVGAGLIGLCMGLRQRPER